MPNPSIWRSLSRAILAGEAAVEPIVVRVERMLGRHWRAIRPVARRYVRLFGEGVRPRQREVEAFLKSRRTRAWSKLRVKEWLTEPERMRPVSGWNVPVIESAGQLAEWLRLRPTELEWFADLRGLATEGRLSHYHYRFLSKSNGNYRVIEAPKPRMKELQRLILAEVVDPMPVHPAVHGFRKGRSILTFAAPHAGQRVVLRMDLENFFPSISGARIQTIFRLAGYPEKVADRLGGICSNAMPAGAPELYRRPHLPQGAPTSPALANLCAYRLDCRLSALAAVAGAQYTRYADDLAFSGGEDFERCVERFLLRVAVIAMEEGFAVNHRKTRVMRQGVRQHLAGLVTNRKVNVMRPDYDRLKAIPTNCVRTGPAGQNRDGHPRFREHLEGRVAFVESVNPSKAKRLRGLFEKINWP